MEKPSFSCKGTFLYKFPFLMVCLLLTSCLDLKIDLTMANNVSGTLVVNALSYKLAKGLELLDGQGKPLFPTTREEWQALVDQVPGMSLVSFSTAAEPLGSREVATLSFANAAALQSFSLLLNQKITLQTDGQGITNFTYDGQVPKLNTASPETKQLWNDLWGDNVWQFTLHAPSGLRSISAGENPTPAQVTLKMRLRELSSDKPYPEWKATW